MQKLPAGQGASVEFPGQYEPLVHAWHVKLVMVSPIKHTDALDDWPLLQSGWHELPAAIRPALQVPDVSQGFGMHIRGGPEMAPSKSQVNQSSKRDLRNMEVNAPITTSADAVFQPVISAPKDEASRNMSLKPVA